LKKLESTPVKEDTLKSWRGELDLKGVVGRKARGRRLGRSLLWLLAAAGILSIGTWLFFRVIRPPVKELARRQPQPFRIAAKPRTASPAVKAAPQTAVPQPAPKKEPPPAVRSRLRPQTGQEKSRSQSGPLKPARPVASAPAVAQPAVAQPAVAAAIPPAGARPQPPPALPAPAPLPAAGPEPAATVIESGESGFVVQAIAWSEQPQQRLAVINGQVVHEKDSVAGAVISEIGLDDVYLKKDGKMWRLQFRR